MTDKISDSGPGISENLYALLVYLHVRATSDLLQAIAHSQLTFAQLSLLERLSDGHRAPTIQQAARMIHISPTGASRLVDELARRGLVQRTVDDNDFRRKRVTITPTGQDALRRLHAARLDQIQAFADTLTSHEREQLARTLEQLVAHRAPLAACRPPTQTAA